MTRKIRMIKSLKMCECFRFKFRKKQKNKKNKKQGSKMKNLVKKECKIVDEIFHLVEEEYRIVGGCYINYYGVHVFLLTSGKILMQPINSCGEIPEKSRIVEYNYFQNRFRGSGYESSSLTYDALRFCGVFEDEDEEDEEENY